MPVSKGFTHKYQRKAIPESLSEDRTIHERRVKMLETMRENGKLYGVKDFVDTKVILEGGIFTYTHFGAKGDLEALEKAGVVESVLVRKPAVKPEKQYKAN